MKKTWLVMRNEITFQVTRRSWLLLTFGLPAIVVLFLFVPPLLRGGSSGVPSEAASTPSSTQLAVEGYVDHSGLVKIVPEDLQGHLLPYPDEASARQALQDGKIASYYVVPQDYVHSGELIRIAPNFTAFSPEGQSWVMRWTLQVNLLGGDIQLAQQVSNPMDLQVTALSNETRREIGEGWAYWIPYATGMILYLVIIMSSSLLRSSMGGERKSRVLEILMVSVNPRQILSGKIIAVAIVGLLQTVIWAGTGYGLLRLTGRAVSLPTDVQVPFSAVVWVAVFFLLGYAIYASLLAGLGALTGPNVPGSSSADFVMIWPLLIPITFMPFLIQYPNGALAVILSLFPLTAPIAMLTRMATGSVPWWQPPLAAALMGVTAGLILRAVAGVFRAQILLSGQAFTTKQFLRLLVNPASEA
jgi:ABC-2 type transport system permease protein